MRWGSHGEPARLVLLRHGESAWNARNLFTGWVNVGLTANGEWEAVRAGRLLATHDQLPGLVHTSMQRRAIRTAELALAACDRDWIPVRRSWRVNGRHYGALQGKDKAQVLAEHGEAQVSLWRRSYAVPPPPLAAGAEHSQSADPRYAALPSDFRPAGRDGHAGAAAPPVRADRLGDVRWLGGCPSARWRRPGISRCCPRVKCGCFT
jgi:2,3-bisphosphoglycerate-dependent phosphoglycerate mutase